MRCPGRILDVCMARWMASGGKRAAAWLGLPETPVRELQHSNKLSPAPCCLPWWALQRSLIICSPHEPPGAASSPHGNWEGRAVLCLGCCPVSHQPLGRGCSPEPRGACPCAPSSAWQSTASALASTERPQPPGKANPPPPAPHTSSHPLSPPGCHIFHPRCKLSSAGKCEAMENRAHPQLLSHLPSPQPLHLTHHRLPSAQHLLVPPCHSSSPPGRTPSPLSCRELGLGLPGGAVDLSVLFQNKFGVSFYPCSSTTFSAPSFAPTLVCQAWLPPGFTQETAPHWSRGRGDIEAHGTRGVRWQGGADQPNSGRRARV